MAVLVTFTLSGMSVEKYETVQRRLEAAGAGVPPGRLCHVSYGDRDTLQVIDVFETRRAFEDFGSTLLPILSELGVSVRSRAYRTYKLVAADGRGAR
jgi:hypothetical protein